MWYTMSIVRHTTKSHEKHGLTGCFSDDPPLFLSPLHCTVGWFLLLVECKDERFRLFHRKLHDTNDVIVAINGKESYQSSTSYLNASLSYISAFKLN